MTTHAMSHYPQQLNQAKARRKRFADGSAVVTYPGGSRLIMESALAKTIVLRDNRTVDYNEPPRQRQ